MVQREAEVETLGLASVSSSMLNRNSAEFCEGGGERGEGGGRQSNGNMHNYNEHVRTCTHTLTPHINNFERATQEKQNGADFRSVAPSSEELWVLIPQMYVYGKGHHSSGLTKL